MRERPWIVSSGVRVYDDWKDNICLLPEDRGRTASLPIQDKVDESFTKGPVKGRPRLASENSEDAVTWSAFRTLELRSTPEKWVPWFWEIAFGQAMPEAIRSALGEFQVFYWRSFPPPPNRKVPEGNSEIDVTLKIGRAALVYIEAKLFSPLSAATTHDPGRDQLIRNIDVGSWASRNGEMTADSFYQVVLSSSRSKKAPVAEVIAKYRNRPLGIGQALSYRTDLTEADFASLASRIGWVCWADMLKIAIGALTG